MSVLEKLLSELETYGPEVLSAITALISIFGSSPTPAALAEKVAAVKACLPK